MCVLTGVGGGKRCLWTQAAHITQGLNFCVRAELDTSRRRKPDERRILEWLREGRKGESSSLQAKGPLWNLPFGVFGLREHVSALYAT